MRELQVLDRNHQVLHPNEDPSAELPLHVRAPVNEAVGPIVELTYALPGRWKPRLLVRQGGFTPLNPVPDQADDGLRKLIAAIQKASPSTKPALMSKLASRAYGACRGISEELSDVLDADAKDKAKAFAEGLPRGLQRCQCRGVDLVATEAAAMLVLDSPAPPIRSLPMPKQDTDPGLSVGEYVTAHRP